MGFALLNLQLYAVHCTLYRGAATDYLDEMGMGFALLNLQLYAVQCTLYRGAAIDYLDEMGLGFRPPKTSAVHYTGAQILTTWKRWAWLLPS